MAKRVPKKAKVTTTSTGDLPPTMTTTGSDLAQTVTVSVKQVLRKQVLRKITLTAGQDGRYDVDFESGELITRQEVRKVMAALQRGYNKYLSNLRKNKGAKQ